MQSGSSGQTRLRGIDSRQCLDLSYLTPFFATGKNRDNSSSLLNPDVGLHDYQSSHVAPCGFFATTTIQPFLE